MSKTQNFKKRTIRRKDHEDMGTFLLVVTVFLIILISSALSQSPDDLLLLHSTPSSPTITTTTTAAAPPPSTPSTQSTANETDASPLTPVMECLSEQDRQFSFVLSTHRNSTGHWLADMDVQPGAWAPAGRDSPFEVHLEHRTRTCVSCEDAMPPYARISLREPPPTKVPTASGYRYFPGFGFYKRHLQELNWREARSVCQEEGADLVVINSDDEAKLLLELSAPMLFLQPASKWNAEAYVGIFDFHHEGNFGTVDGSTLNESGYVNWSPGEPNNHREEDCVTIVRNAMYNDVGCSKTFEFICEISE